MNSKLLAAVTAFFLMAGAAAPALSDELVLISSHTREFIGADASANQVLKGVPQEAQAIILDRITLDGSKVAFRARDGKFLRAGVGQQTLLAAVSDHIRGWETFEIVRVTNAKFAIKSVQNGSMSPLAPMAGCRPPLPASGAARRSRRGHRRPSVQARPRRLRRRLPTRGSRMCPISRATTASTVSAPSTPA